MNVEGLLLSGSTDKSNKEATFLPWLGIMSKKREWWDLPASQEPAVAPRVARRPGRFNTWSIRPATVPPGPSLRPPQDNRQFPPRREPREPPPADGAQEAGRSRAGLGVQQAATCLACLHH